MRGWAIAGVVGVLIAVVVAVALTHGGGEEQDAALTSWQDDLAEWETEQMQTLVLPEGPALTDVVTGAALHPIGRDAAVESLDEVNDACTRLTAFADQVDSTPGPPALPTDVTASEEQTADFEADLAALTTFQQALDGPAATVRQFCGTYPLLVTAHTVDDVEEAEAMFAQALRTQCPLAELAEVCESLAAGQGTAPPAEAPAVVAEQLGAAEAAIDEAASAFAADLAAD
ncbi:hypothetical protein [Ruania albidiflava]|uniref:hypothetical protein n=1 Tax=Ruania albidiflava TaxID=366586 RepID=UPI0003B48616|nr:hypothetical protein [Ruania albidiflava]